MKTPTLIVRLIGFYLLGSATVALFQLRSMGMSFRLLGVSVWGYIVVGLAASLFAGPLARILTFDSERREQPVDFTDQCLRSKQDVPNQLPDPTSKSVTPPAGAGGAPYVAADH